MATPLGQEYGRMEDIGREGQERRERGRERKTGLLHSHNSRPSLPAAARTRWIPGEFLVCAWCPFLEHWDKTGVYGKRRKGTRYTCGSVVSWILNAPICLPLYTFWNSKLDIPCVTTGLTDGFSENMKDEDSWLNPRWTVSKNCF